MSKEKLYREFPTERVPGEIIEGGDLPEQDEKDYFPFRKYLDDELGRRFPAFSIIPMSYRKGERANEDNDAGTLSVVKPTFRHGRDFELGESQAQSGRESKPLALWADENGILFGEINLKGANLEDPRIERVDYTIRVFGMQSLDELPKAMRASRYLRERGVETEKVERVIEPRELIVRGKRFTTSELKEKMLDDLEKRLIQKEAIILDEEQKSGASLTVKDFPLAKSEVEHMRLVFAVRSQQVTERLVDLSTARNEFEFKQILGKVFAFINLRENIEAKKEGREPRLLDAKNPEDIRFFLSDYLPSRMARNLARLHNAGAAHRFPHAQNWSLSGSIYDLQTAKIEAPGFDDHVDARDLERDLQWTINGVMQTFLSGKESYGSRSYQGGWLERELGPAAFGSFIENFLVEYVKTVDPKKLIPDLPAYGDFEKNMIEKYTNELRSKIEAGTHTMDQVISFLDRQGNLVKKTEKNYINRIKRRIEIISPELLPETVEVSDPESPDQTKKRTVRKKWTVAREFSDKIQERVRSNFDYLLERVKFQMIPDPEKRMTHEEIRKAILDRISGAATVVAEEEKSDKAS